MRVASKIILVASVALLPALAVHTWLSLEREEALFRSDMERDLSLLGAHLREMVASEWQRNGDAGVRTLLDAAADADAPVSIDWRTPARAVEQRPVGLQPEPENGSLVWVERVEVEGQDLGELTLRESLAPMDRYLRGTVLRIGMLSVVLAGASLLAARLLSHRLIGRRLDALVRFTATTGAGHLGQHIDVGGRDEITGLAESLEAMSGQLAEARLAAERSNQERLVMLHELRHVDRLTTMGRLSGSIAHELGTPLNVVLGHADRIAEGTQAPEETKESAVTIHRQVRRMEATIRHILGFVRKAPAKESAVDMAAVAAAVRGLLEPLAVRRNVTIEENCAAGPAIVRGDEVRLEQALSNLVSNAIDASPEGGRIELALSCERRTPRAGGAPRPVIVLRVQDEGEGIPEGMYEQLFEPFATSKPPGQGTGLGLWIADGIVRDHRGTIEVNGEGKHGSCFAIVLPALEGG